MPTRYNPLTASLRSRLLLLTILFVMIVEMLLYVPSIALYRQRFIEERLSAGQIAALSLEESQDNMVSQALERKLLNAAGLRAIIVRRESRSLLLGFGSMPDATDKDVDLRNPSIGALIMDAYETLRLGGDRVIRVIGEPILADTRYVEAHLDEKLLYEALVRQSNTILILSLLVSVFTGFLVYQALDRTVVRPLRRMKKNIMAFSQHPEGAPTFDGRSNRADEIGVIERALASMQAEVRQSIQRQTRLAELGEAVAKINHDLRNILATVQLSSNTLQRVDHPLVRRVSSRLIRAVSRAIKLCERTLRHGKAAEPAPDKASMMLKPLVLEVGEALDLLADKRFRFEVAMPDDFEILADAEQMHRVFLNLVRNARQVQAEGGLIRTAAEHREDGSALIRLEDHGGGIPKGIQPALFKAFQTDNKTDGTGLGLAVAREIIEAHGGSIEIERTGDDGTVFLVILPGLAADQTT